MFEEQVVSDCVRSRGLKFRQSPISQDDVVEKAAGCVAPVWPASQKLNWIRRHAPFAAQKSTPLASCVRNRSSPVNGSRAPNFDH